MAEHLPALLERIAARSEAFITTGDLTWTGAEFAERARAIAGGLTAAGVRPGDRVLLCLAAGSDQAAAFFAVGWIGALSILVNPRLKDAQVRHLVDDGEPRLVLVDSTRAVGLVDFAATFGSADVATLAEAAHHGAEPLALRPVQAVERSPDDPATILYTSGSTGLPKGIVQSHRSLCDGARIVSDYLGLRPGDHLLAVLPLSFDYGLNQILDAAWVGCRVTIRPFLTIGDTLRALQSCTVLAGVPEIWVDFVDGLDRGIVDKTDLGTLRVVTNTGGRLPVRCIEWFGRELPHVQVFSMFGLTEAFRSSYVPPDAVQQRPRSIGRAIPGVELLVLDRETGEPCAPGQVGELVHCGALIADGYWRRAEQTAERFRSSEATAGRRCVFSGDLVTRDEDGFLHFVGRADAMIKVQGYRISPEEVATFVQSIDGVERAGVVGVAVGDDGLNALVVCVVPDAGVDRESLPQSVIKACRRGLPSYMIPARVFVMDTLPRSPNQKIDHAALRTLVRERL